MKITLTGVVPYDGSYELDFENELTTREWGWVKRLAGYLPLALEEASVGGDPEFACVLAVIAMRRAGKIEIGEVPAVFDRLIDAPFGSSVILDAGEPVEQEDDAGPPDRSSNGNDASSGPASKKSSETSTQNQPGSGTPAWAISQSGPPTSAT